MAQILIENNQGMYQCTICHLGFKSEPGLQYHMKKKHPLDLPSGLHCFTCNKSFTNRDIQLNHFKTVSHQLECRRLKQEEEVEMTKIEEELTYRRQLLEMNNFKPRPYKPREWKREDTVLIPLQSREILQDPRRKTLKRVSPSAPGTSQKVQKISNLPDLAEKHTVATTESPIDSKKNTLETEVTLAEDNQVILHITESDDKLFPEAEKEECNIVETRRVYINNEWKITDTIGTSDFDELISNQPDIDWLSFITDNNLF